MPRPKRPPPPAGDGVPAWFMTYSDVITLMMTFFILLLTFATDEPESFARMQVVTFGGTSNATGLVAPKPHSVDRDALALRMRPSAARVGSRGSETPPFETDPALETLSRGLDSLERPHALAHRQSFRFALDWASLFDADGKPAEFAAERFRLLAVQMRRMPLDVRLQVPSSDDLPRAVLLAEQVSRFASIPAGRLSVGVAPDPAASAGKLQIIVYRSSAPAATPAPRSL